MNWTATLYDYTLGFVWPQTAADRARESAKCLRSDEAYSNFQAACERRYARTQLRLGHREAAMTAAREGVAHLRSARRAGQRAEAFQQLATEDDEANADKAFTELAREILPTAGPERAQALQARLDRAEFRDMASEARRAREREWSAAEKLAVEEVDAGKVDEASAMREIEEFIGPLEATGSAAVTPSGLPDLAALRQPSLPVFSLVSAASRPLHPPSSATPRPP